MSGDTMKNRKSAKNALLKDIFSQILKTRNRFLSILCIVMLGSGFFAGVKSTCPDMKETAQSYFEDQNLMDLHLKSTWGFTQSDLSSLKSAGQVRQVSAGYMADAYHQTKDDAQNIVRLYSWSKDDPIDQPFLLEGRLPQNETECLADIQSLRGETFKLGQKLVLSGGDDLDLQKTLSHTEFTVVGLVRSPLYINFERGNSTLGNGVVNNYLYLPEKAFSYEYYTDVWMTFENTRGLDFYGSEYKREAKLAKKAVEKLAGAREITRRDETYKQAQEKIEASQKELDDGAAAYQRNLADFELQTTQAQNKLDASARRLNASQTELTENEAKLQSGRAQYSAALAALQQNQNTYDSGRAEYLKARLLADEVSNVTNGIRFVQKTYASAQLEEGQAPSEEVVAVINASGALDRFTGGGFSFPTLLTKYLSAPADSAEKAQLSATMEPVLSAIEQELARQMPGLEKTAAQLEASRQELDAGWKQLAAQSAALEETQQKLDAGKAALKQGRAQLESGLAALEKQRTEGGAQLEEAASKLETGRAELLKARHDLNDLGSPEWFVLDRSSNPGYAEFSQDAERIDKIAAVFPVFFILVAALVCLTTMTRMVEEQRTQIGTLKALGYGRGAVMAKYLVYAVSASLIGSVAGLLIGFRLFPTIIFNAYRIMYVMPDVQTPFRPGYALLCIAASVACTALAALAACYKELASSPSQLMRPQAPPAGKRILLERFSPLWKRLSFLKKVSLRNLFRYKKRIWMTVVGIAGCTALMLAGFGLKHSISTIVEKQYETIFTYDATVGFDEKLTDDEKAEILAQAQSASSEAMMLRQNAAEISSAETGQKSIYLFISAQPDALKDFISLHHRTDSDPVSLKDDGVILTEKMARLLKVSAGDTVTLWLDDTQKAEFKVTDIAENYLLNFIYMTPRCYANAFGSDARYNSVAVRLNEQADQNAFSTALLKNNNVRLISFTSDGGQQFRDVVKSLNYIVLVLIVCAGLLAFVVLYNLANINIEERIREIATIKVLGFYDAEVSAYVSRENTISSLLGMGAGLILGIPFERFIIHTAEVDAVMFNPDIGVWSFVLAGLFTFGFSLLVNSAMHFHLKKISMVESLKSVE